MSILLLEEQLQNKYQVTIAHLEGMGGIGKTELAIAYSLTNLQCNTYPGGICWLFCRDQDIGLQKEEKIIIILEETKESVNESGKTRKEKGASREESELSEPHRF